MDDTRRTRARLAVEAIVATALALALAVGLELASAWLLVAIAATALGRRSLDDLALEPRLTPPSLGVHLLVAPLLLVGYAAAHLALAVASGARIEPGLPPDLLLLFLHHLLVVSLPEEVFFRGYLFSILDRAFPRPRGRLAGALVGPALFLQAALFALCHVTTGDWTRLRVGAFGLLAGWFRVRSGSLAAPVLYHAVANVWVAIVEASLR